MNGIFPFGFPGPTALYLGLYVLTLAGHVLFMSYVLSGTAYLAMMALGGRDGRREATLRSVIVDYLPFAVGLAITAGVAPLLFVQILYEHRFYTANLLLFHRWMVIVPALIAGFYLLYLLKSGFVRGRKTLWRITAAGAFACFAFVAWSFTENHLLSRDQHVWVEVFASGRFFYPTWEVVPRLAVWFFGAGTVAAPLMGWQLRRVRDEEGPAAPKEIKRLALLALLGIVGAGVAVPVYMALGPRDALATATGPMALPYAVMTVVGGVVQLAVWLGVLRKGELETRPLWLATAGLSLSLIGSGVVRESLRLAAVDIEALYPLHASAAESQGLIVFLVFFAINAVVIAGAVRLGIKAGKLDEEVPAE